MIYYLGGGTCCGKSTVTEHLRGRYGLCVYKLDDDLFDFLRRMAEEGHPLAAAELTRSPEEAWMRDPALLCEETILLYRDMAPYWQAALAARPDDRPVLAEGAGFMPELMQAIGVPRDRYLCMAPTRSFQYDRYARRPWIDQILAGVSDREAAFRNWMERDVLFADRMMREAEALGYPTLRIDGSRSIEETAGIIAKSFHL